MAETYSLLEVLQMAEAIERNGGKFYRQAAEMTADAQAQAVMLDLAAQEDEHEKFFATLREELCSSAEASWWDPSGEAAAYIQAAAETHVFNITPDVTALLASVQSAESALRLALGFEKDTIAFFISLRAAVAEQQRERVDLLVDEEIRHMRRLNDAIKALPKQ